MARWGRCDYRELKKLDERLQQLSEVDMDRLCRDAAKKVAQILLNKVKKRTPVGVVPSYATDEAKQEYWAGYSGGSLRDAWTILPIEKHGDQYTVTHHQQLGICVLCGIRPPANTGALCSRLG